MLGHHYLAIKIPLPLNSAFVGRIDQDKKKLKVIDKVANIHKSKVTLDFFHNLSCVQIRIKSFEKLLGSGDRSKQCPIKLIFLI